ncbi:MAG TPA: STAS domain-containing protein [Isosphaeraceae bacterium]|jgi:anti-anti-sigma factor|nr:STAS domain-containing protein [Isosphaeraceae bacterium]
MRPDDPFLDDLSSPIGPGALAVADGHDREADQKIEDWIVCHLDDRPPGARGSGLPFSFDDLPSLRKVPAQGPRASTTASGRPLGTEKWSRFHTTTRRGVTIVRLGDASLVREALIVELADELAALIEAGLRRIVLDLSRVERLSSLGVAALAKAYRRCTEFLGGMLRICGLQPQVAEIFGILGLSREIATFVDEHSAVDFPWPGGPAATALPVTILSSLSAALAQPAAEAETRVDLPVVAEADAPATEEETEIYPDRWAGPTGLGLVIRDARGESPVIPIASERFDIGREADCQLRIIAATVSRHHARIERDGPRVALRDLGSTNGTIHNGQVVRAATARLADGDVVEVGPLRITVLIDPARIGGIDDLVVRWLTEDDDGPADPDDEPAAEPPPTLEGLTPVDLGDDPGPLKAEVLQDVLIVTPMSHHLDDESQVGPLRDLLTELFDRPLPKRVVLHLTHVTRLSSLAIGMLVAHELRLRRAGGELRFCDAQPGVQSYLEQVKLPMLVEFHPALEDAVLTPWH